MNSGETLSNESPTLDRFLAIWLKKHKQFDKNERSIGREEVIVRLRILDASFDAKERERERGEMRTTYVIRARV